MTFQKQKSVSFAIKPDKPGLNENLQQNSKKF